MDDHTPGAWRARELPPPTAPVPPQFLDAGSGSLAASLGFLGLVVALLAAVFGYLEWFLHLLVS